MAQGIGDIFLNLRINKSQAEKDLKSVGSYADNVVGKSFKSLGLTLAKGLSVAALIKFSKSCIDVGSSVAEVQNVVDVTFSGMTDAVNEFAENAMFSYGLSELSAKQYTGTMGAMLKSMGLSKQEASDMSITIAKLAGDFASFYNLDTDETFAKIRSGISGETEPLKQLGINMSVTNLEAYALSQGITKAYNSMSQGEQALLRYNYLLSVSADAQGDFARTSGSWANQVRILQLQWESFKSSLGQAFIAVLTPAIQMLNKLLSWINGVTKAFASMIATLTGSKVETSTTAVTDGLNSAGGAASSATDASNGLGNSLKKAAKAARSLMGFDELNILNTQSNSDNESSSGGSIGSVTGNVETVTETIGEDQSESIGKLSGILEKFSKIKFDKLISSAGKLKEQFLQFGGHVWEGIQWGMDNILYPLSKWTVEDALPVFLDTVSNCLGILNSTITVLKPLGGWLWNTFLVPFATFTADVFIGMMELINEKLTAFSTWIIEHEELVQEIAIVIGSFAVAWGLVNVAVGIWNGLCLIASGVTTALGIAFNFLVSPIGLATLAIASVILVVITLIRHWDEVKEAAAKCWDWIVEKWNGAAAWFDSTIVQPIKNGFKDFINGLIGSFEGFVNKGIAGINWLIDGLNSLSFTVPDWIPDWLGGGKSFGVNISPIGNLSLPRLAEGGVVNTPTLSMIGEAGQEAVVPLKNNTEWTSQVAELLSGKMGNTSVLESKLDTMIELLRQLLDKDGNVYLFDEIVGLISDAIDQSKSRKGVAAFSNVRR